MLDACRTHRGISGRWRRAPVDDGIDAGAGGGCGVAVGARVGYGGFSTPSPASQANQDNRAEMRRRGTVDILLLSDLVARPGLVHPSIRAARPANPNSTGASSGALSRMAGLC